MSRDGNGAHIRIRPLSVLAALFGFLASLAGAQTIYEVGKEGDAPEPPKVVPLTTTELCGIWKAEKIGANDAPEDELYVYFDEKGATVAEGKYKDWKGGLVTGSGEMNFYRKPKAEEMSDKAPQWARDKIASEGKLEWKMALKAESRKGEWVLEGKWYPGQFKWEEKGDKKEASYLDEGKAVDMKFKKSPVVVRTVVLNNQTGFNKGLPWHPYPFVYKPPADFRKRDSYALVAPPPRNGLGQEGDERMLFVCGVSLPTNYDKKIEIRGVDSTIKYLPIALATDNLNADNKRLFKAGWDVALKGLDRDTEQTVRKCAAMLVRADLQRGVVTGVKNFTLNKATDSWRLRFGDDGGMLTFARDLTAEENEDIDCGCLPEKVYIEIRTETPFPTQEIALRAQLNDRPVTWNGAPTIVAKYIKDVGTPSAYEVPRPGEPAEVVPKVVRVYRTPTIQIGGNKSSAGNGYYLAATDENTLRVRPDDPYLFTFRPGEASLKIWDTPDRDAAGNLVGTWEETVYRAAVLDGLGDKVKSGQKVGGSKAGAISNVVVSNIALGKFRPAGEALKQSLYESFHSWTTLTPLWAPAIAWRFFFGNPGILTERVNITVSDHAALLLFKEAFIRKMSMGLVDLDKQTKSQANPAARRAMLLGLREGLKASAGKKSSPWDSIQVPGPKGSEVKFSWALDDGMRKLTCKDMSDDAAEEWSLKAVENGLEQYKANIRYAIGKAKATPDDDLKKLLELIGYGYENLAPEVMQHMMWHGSPALPQSPLWLPNLNARYALLNLHTASDAMRAQEDLSKLDTQMVMLAAGALAAPFMLSENLFLQVCLYAMDVATFEGQLISESIPELWEQYQREEIRFAIGASLVLGTERLNEAEIKRTEWYQTALNVLPAAMGVTMGGEGLRSMTRASAKTKAALIIEAIEKHGLDGVKRLTNSEKLALLIHASEAEALKEMGAAKMLEQSHERAAAAAEKIAAEAGAARHARSELPTNRTNATGNGAMEPAKPLQASANASGDKVRRSDIEWIELSDEDLAGARPKTQQYPATDFPPEKPTNVQKPAGSKPVDAPPEPPTEQRPPIEFPPEKPTNVQKPPAKPAKVPPQPVEKTPQVLRTADDFAEMLAPPPEPRPGQPAPPPKPTYEGAEVRVRVNNDLVDLTLGKKLGEGGFAGVWEIANGPAKYKGKAVKLTYLDRGEAFRMRPEEFETASRREAVQQSHVGYKEDVEAAVALLDGKNKTNTRFEYAAIRGTGADENVAVVIQDRIHVVESPDLAKEGDCLILRNSQFVQWADKYDLADAVVELFWQLKEAGLVWEDCKLSNMFFRKKDGRWVAGILDVDRLYVHADRIGRRGIFLDFIEAANVFFKSDIAGAPSVNSLDNSTRLMFADQNHAAADFMMRQNGAIQGPYFKDAEEFMMIMFEYHGWIAYDKASRKFVRRLLDPAVIQRRILPGQTDPAFPKLSDPARFKPRSLDAPYIPPPKIGMFPVLRDLNLNETNFPPTCGLTTSPFMLQAA
jgi:hypothetical protein